MKAKTWNGPLRVIAWIVVFHTVLATVTKAIFMDWSGLNFTGENGPSFLIFVLWAVAALIAIYNAVGPWNPVFKEPTAESKAPGTKAFASLLGTVFVGQANFALFEATMLEQALLALAVLVGAAVSFSLLKKPVTNHVVAAH